MARKPVRKRLTRKKGTQKASKKLTSVEEHVSTLTMGMGNPFDRMSADLSSERNDSTECGLSSGVAEGNLLTTGSTEDHNYVSSQDSVFNPVEDIIKVEATSTENECPKKCKTYQVESVEAVRNLFLEVRLKVEAFLPRGWSAVVANGDCELSVHCQLVSIEPYIVQAQPPLHLSKDTVDYFVDRIISLVGKVTDMQICSGYDESKYEAAWRHCPFGKIDDNPYRESRYFETFRSFNCKLLVPKKKWRCAECLKLYGPLKRRAKASADEQRHVNTPNIYLTEEQKLKKLRSVREDLDRAKATITRLHSRMQDVIQKRGVQIEESISSGLQEILDNADTTPAQSIFLQQQIKASQGKRASSMRWHPTMIRLALSIHLTSPAAYEMLRATGMVKLPSSRTLFDYSHVKSIEEGINTAVLESVAERVANFPEDHKKFHVLMADEMHISQNLVFQKSSGRLIGYTSLDDVDHEVKILQQYIDNPAKDSEEIVASKVMVYMIKGVTNGIKEVVATYGVGTLSANQMYLWTWKVIGALERSGIAVIAFVSDGASTNRTFIKKHKPATPDPTENGIVFNTVNKVARDRKLYFLSDVPHLLKTIRNCLLNSRWDNRRSRRRMMKCGKKISWDFIIKLNELKKSQTLRKSYKLNAMNVYPDSYARMKVKYAGQVLSKTVCMDLRSQGWNDAEETANFIELTNDWFDCLNGAHSSMAIKRNNMNVAPYTSFDDNRFNLLNNFLRYLDDWESEAKNPNFSMEASFAADTLLHDLNDSEIEEAAFNPKEETAASKRILSKQTLDGIRMTTLAFEPLVKDMLAAAAKFINARVFCQDPLEQHFSRIRAGQGGSNNPNLGQVLNRNKVLHTISQLGMKRPKGNSSQDESHVQVTSGQLPKRKCDRTPKFL